MRDARVGEQFVDERGHVLVAVPVHMFDALCLMRDEYSAFLTSMGLNLHGQPMYPPEERYGSIDDE